MSVSQVDLVTAPAVGVRDKKRVLTSAFVGTTVEWYDFYLYGTASALIFNLAAIVSYRERSVLSAIALVAGPAQLAFFDLAFFISLFTPHP